MSWPEVDGNTITTDNGLRIEFPEPGRVAKVSYDSAEADDSFELTQTARHAAAPARPRDARARTTDSDPEPRARVASSRSWRCTGELVLRRRALRDRLQRGARPLLEPAAQRAPGLPVPPVGWSPMYFGEDLAFNQVGYEPLDTDPAWAGLYEVPEDAPDLPLGLGAGRRRAAGAGQSVRRNVHEYHPRAHCCDAPGDRGDRRAAATATASRARRSPPPRFRPGRTCSR